MRVRVRHRDRVRVIELRVRARARVEVDAPARALAVGQVGTQVGAARRGDVAAALVGEDVLAYHLGRAGVGVGLGVGVGGGGLGGAAGGGLTLHGAPLALAPGPVIGACPFFFGFCA